MQRIRYPRFAMSGFTLIELMLVVVVVGILTAVAYPMYSDHVQRGRIAEATSTLSELRIRMERFFQDNRTFMNGAVCGVPMPGNNSFSYSCVGNATTFTLTATGIAGMNGFVFTVNQDNLRRTTSFQGAVVDQNCWMTRRGDRC